MISGLDVLKPNDIGIYEANAVVFPANPPCDVGTFGNEDNTTTTETTAPSVAILRYWLP